MQVYFIHIKTNQVISLCLHYVWSFSAQQEGPGLNPPGWIGAFLPATPVLSHSTTAPSVNGHGV